jgi:hypothetical protein
MHWLKELLKFIWSLCRLSSHNTFSWITNVIPTLRSKNPPVLLSPALPYRNSSLLLWGRQSKGASPLDRPGFSLFWGSHTAKFNGPNGCQTVRMTRIRWILRGAMVGRPWAPVAPSQINLSFLTGFPMKNNWIGITTSLKWIVSGLFFTLRVWTQTVHVRFYRVIIPYCRIRERSRSSKSEWFIRTSRKRRFAMQIFEHSSFSLSSRGC